jgi:hypothetical protein
VSDLDAGTLGTRQFDDGRTVRLHPMTFGKVRLCVYPNPWSWAYDDGY